MVLYVFILLAKEMFNLTFRVVTEIQSYYLILFGLIGYVWMYCGKYNKNKMIFTYTFFILFIVVFHIALIISSLTQMNIINIKSWPFNVIFSDNTVAVSHLVNKCCSKVDQISTV